MPLLIGAPCSCRACELLRNTHPQSPPSLVRRTCKTCRTQRAALRVEPAETPCPTCDPDFYVKAEAEAEAAKVARIAAKKKKKTEAAKAPKARAA